MRRISFGLFIVALTTLMVELVLIKVFDVIWTTNMSYLVVTCAMFCFGIAGVYSTLRPISEKSNVRIYLTAFSLIFSFACLAILPTMNIIPFRFDLLSEMPVKGVVFLLAIYTVLALPFFFAGMIFTTVFSTYAEKIQTLYFWDLAGAALGCIVLVPFIPYIGPGGLLFVACAFGLIATALFCQVRWISVICLICALPFFITPFLKSSGYYDFKHHISKRSFNYFLTHGFVENTFWDPVSKIDVVNLGDKKWIAYDGGSQSSYIYPFDGDFVSLRENISNEAGKQFWGAYVLASHYLKRDSDQKVLVIGSAGGQEVKAALLYGATKIDAVELVDYVVKIGKSVYAEYNGGIFVNSRVNSVSGEGRAFLQTQEHQYDIIQIFSNHTSSSIAAGSGAMATNYLQTAEAYQEYFKHLTPNGILHINHHVYPKMITTAALAWKNMGRENFQRHVAVFELKKGQDNLSTLLIKMTPWTENEINELKGFISTTRRLVEDPLHPEKSFLSADFYGGEFSPELAQSVPYRVSPMTDDRPYFNFLRKIIGRIEPDSDQFLNASIAGLLNSQMEKYIPRDIVHLFVTGVISVFFTVLFIIIPLFFSSSGKTKWPHRISALTYFSCLGAGFIILELVFIQIFMKLIGFPLYTYSTVVFTMLLSASIWQPIFKKNGNHY